jgi:hypothetical protein
MNSGASARAEDPEEAHFELWDAARTTSAVGTPNVVVVGGGLTGGNAALGVPTRPRRSRHAHQLEAHLPYRRPPLSGFLRGTEPFDNVRCPTR